LAAQAVKEDVMLALEKFGFAPFDEIIDSLVPVDARTGWLWHGFSPEADIRESADGYLIELDLPGLTEKDVEITLEGHHLTVKGERKAPEVDGYNRRERGYGRFERVFHLPDDSDPARIEAKAKNGVLTVNVPKAESAKPRTISVVAS
jgi:HSP20 family protein